LSPGSPTIVTPVDLYAFGPRSGPKPPRVGVDLSPDAIGMVGPETPPFPAGASTFADPALAPLTGHYHCLPKGTPLPAEMAVVADGIDVNPNSPHAAAHHTFYPLNRMSVDQFTALFLALPWQYAGKKP
jgi:hypothetical protein